MLKITTDLYLRKIVDACLITAIACAVIIGICGGAHLSALVTGDHTSYPTIRMIAIIATIAAIMVLLTAVICVGLIAKVHREAKAAIPIDYPGYEGNKNS